MLKEDEKARWLGWCGSGTNLKYVKPGFPCQNLVILAYLTFCRILDLQVGIKHKPSSSLLQPLQFVSWIGTGV